MKKRNLIGLTGNIATGKSAVAHILKELGALVIDADQVARAVVQPGQPTLTAIVAAFGRDVLHPDGMLNRKALGALVFSDPTRLRHLEQVMQPGIRAALQQAIDGLPADRIGVLEAIRLIEAGWDNQCDSIWVTTCPPEVQVQRLMQDRHLSETDARSRIYAQNPSEDKLARADVIIDTSSDIAETKRQVMTSWAHYVDKTA
jgi:dephospho-CoA kinase